MTLAEKKVPSPGIEEMPWEHRQTRTIRHAQEVEGLTGWGLSVGSTHAAYANASRPSGRLMREDPVPAVDRVDEIATENRAEDRAQQHQDTEDGHQPAHPVRARRLGHDRHAERQEATTEALENAIEDELVDQAGSRGAEGPSPIVKNERHHVQAFGAEAVGGPASQQDDRGQGEGYGP